MKMLFRRLLLFFALSLSFISSVSSAPSPQTIPAIQEWMTGTGTCTFSTTSRVMINTADTSNLWRDGITCANDLSGLLGRAVTLMHGSLPNDGDIFVKLGDTDTTIGDEGYRIAIQTFIQISARTGAGAFYGTRTLLQMLKQGTTLNQGTIRDWPRGKWRGMMVDCGRKFFTPAWLQRNIRDMAYMKMNFFHLHLSDAISKTNNGYFRLECSSHPEICSTAIQPKEYYTKKDIQELQALAARYHITIVPEFDFPGHCSWLYSTHHKNLLLDKKVLDGGYWALDLSKDSTYALVRDIINEFMPLFPGPYWHIGTDEYMTISEFSLFPQLAAFAKKIYGPNAIANDSYRHFANWADTLVRSKGKITMAWNDLILGLAESGHGVCPVNKTIHLDFWSNLAWVGWGGVPPSVAKSLGYMMLNTGWGVYFILGNSSTGSPLWVYNSWELNTFEGGNLAVNDPAILGGSFPIWCDNPGAMTEEQVWTNSFMLNRAIAQKTWGCQKIAPNYTADFVPLANSIGRAPVPGQCVTIRYPLFHSPQEFACAIKKIEIFNLKGVLVKTVPGTEIYNNRNSGIIHASLINDAKMPNGSYIFRLIGAGKEILVPQVIMH